MKWRTLTGVKVPDVIKFILAATKGGQEVHIGTDSLQTGRFTQFCTVVVTHTPGKGGRVAYAREVVPRIASLRERLSREVWSSVTLALELAPKLGDRITVHIDANTNPRYRSAEFAQDLVGMVMGQGFKYAIKPHAWAASHAADHIVRHCGKLPREDAA